jgi:hypothetical protein
MIAKQSRQGWFVTESTNEGSDSSFPQKTCRGGKAQLD